MTQEERGQEPASQEVPSGAGGGEGAGTRRAADGGSRQPRVPEGLWIICPGCREIIYRKEVERNQRVCPKCSHHFRIGAQERVRLLVDEGSFCAQDFG